MPTLTIPGYKGGQALNLFDALAKQTFQTAKDLDVYAEGNVLRPHKLKFQTVALPTVAGGSSITVANAFTASNGKTYVLGSATITAQQNIVLWSTPTLGSNPTWTADYNAVAASPGTVMDEYKDGLFFGYGTNLDRWGNLSGVPARSSISTGLDAQPSFIRAHRGLGKLYVAHSKKIASYDNSTVTLAALTVEQSDTIVGMEPYGRFMIVGIRGAGSTRSRFLVWNGSDTTVDDTIDLGEVGLQGFRIVNGVIEFICLTYVGATGANDFIRLMTVQPGGVPKLIQERTYSVTAGSGSASAFSNFGDLFLYAFNGATYDIDLGIYAFGSGSGNQNKYPSLWRLPSTGVTTGLSITSIQHNGDNIILIWSTSSGGGTYHIDTTYGSDFTLASPSTGVYQSNAFPLNNGKMGKIKRILILHKNLATSCGFTVKIKHFGHYPIGGSIASADSFVVLTTPQGTGNGSTGQTQSTDNAAYTVIEVSDKFKEARFAQLEIDWDEVSSTNAAEILFPIIIETVDGANTI